MLAFASCSSIFWNDARITAWVMKLSTIRKMTIVDTRMSRERVRIFTVEQPAYVVFSRGYIISSAIK
jgi:hypothetical protein